MANLDKIRIGGTDYDITGKYAVVSATESMSVNAATFTSNSIVKVSSAITIASVDALDYEVVIDVAANVALTLTPTNIPTIGKADNTKRRMYSFLNGTLVVGNFE